MRACLLAFLLLFSPSLALGASGDTLFAAEAGSFTFPSTNYPTYDVRNTAHLVLEYDGTTEETGYVSGVLPRNYAGGGVTVTVVWMADTATSGDVIWLVTWERHDTGTDLDADSFSATVGTVTTTTSATAGAPSYSTINFTNGAQMDSLAVGEHFRLRVARDADAAGDTMNATDAQLIAVEVKEQ